MPNDRPVIGDFRKSTDDAPREKPVPPAPVAPPAPKAAEPVSQDKAIADTVASLEALKRAEAALTPSERYQKRLVEANISMSEATSIFDGVLSKGYYEEYVRLGKDTRAVFRTRLYDDALRLQTALEYQKPQLAITQDDLVTRYNLAASLYEWDKKAIPHVTDEDFAKALAIVRRLPGPVYSLLATRLVAFDHKVMTVFSEGSAENFS